MPPLKRKTPPAPRLSIEQVSQALKAMSHFDPARYAAYRLWQAGWTFDTLHPLRKMLLRELPEPFWIAVLNHMRDIERGRREDDTRRLLETHTALVMKW